MNVIEAGLTAWLFVTLLLIFVVGEGARIKIMRRQV
jgi:hypothetical protein